MDKQPGITVVDAWPTLSAPPRSTQGTFHADDLATWLRDELPAAYVVIHGPDAPEFDAALAEAGINVHKSAQTVRYKRPGPGDDRDTQSVETGKDERTRE